MKDGQGDFRRFAARGIFCRLDDRGKKVCVANGFYIANKPTVYAIAVYPSCSGLAIKTFGFR